MVTLGAGEKQFLMKPIVLVRLFSFLSVSVRLINLSKQIRILPSAFSSVYHYTDNKDVFFSLAVDRYV